MPTTIDTGDLELPFMIEISQDLILTALQGQVSTEIYPESLAFDSEGFVWDEGDIVLDLTFKDRRGFARGRVIVQPCSNPQLDVCFLANVKFLEYMAPVGSS